MSKWHSLLEYFQFPLKVLFFATIILGVGSFVSNPNLNLIGSEVSVLYNICMIMKYIGGILIAVFPFLVFVKALGRRFEDSPPVLIGIFSFIMILCIVMILQKSDFPIYFYNTFLGIQESTTANTNVLQIIQNPYNMGIFSLLAAYYITKFAYRRSRHHIRHGFFYFIDHDTWAMMITFVLSALVGVLFVFVWPYVIMTMSTFFEYIAFDILSPLRLFFFGIFERFSAMIGLNDIVRNIFWLSEAGGSFIDSVGNTFTGDVAIWEAIKGVENVNVNAGQFVSAYYIINIFLIPAFLIAYYRLMGKKDNRKKYLVFIIIACILSILCGNPLPIELCMLIISPLLYFVYLIMVGFSFALLTSLEVFIGFSFDGTLISALPGSIVDLFAYLQTAQYYQEILTLLITGIVLGTLFYFSTLFYFKKAAIGLLSMYSAENVAALVIEAMGGLENIIAVDATPDKLIASFKSRDIVDLDYLKDLGAYLILESRDGYYIRLGNMSIMVCEQIKQIMKQ